MFQRKPRLAAGAGYEGGLSSADALDRTIEGIEAELEAREVEEEEQQQQREGDVRKGLDPSEVSSLFPWPSLAAGVVLGLALMAAAAEQEGQDAG